MYRKGYCSALRRVVTTSSVVSTALVATSIAATITFLPRIYSIRSIGTREFWHSSEMMSLADFFSEQLSILPPLGNLRLLPVGIAFRSLCVFRYVYEKYLQVQLVSGAIRYQR